MSVITSKLILELLDRVTAPANTAAGAMGRLQHAAANNARQMDRMRGRMIDAAAMGYVLARAVSAPITAAVDFESAMADVNKVVTFTEGETGLAKMSKDIIAMSQKIPMAANDIAKLVEAAGQSGMAESELLTFAELAAKVGVAFDMSADQVGENLAKIKTALGLSVADTKDLADAINHLSNTSASSAPDLLNYMRRVGSAGKQYGFTKEQTLAVGSAMISAGFQADVAATSFRNMGKALMRGGSATARQAGAYRKLGLNAKTVAKDMQKDAVGTMNKVIGKIRELPKELQASMISDLFGDEARAVAPLIENADLLANSLAQVSDKANFVNSSEEEYKSRAATTANALQMLQNRWDALSITIGAALLPALNDFVAMIGPIIGHITDFAEANPGLTSSIVMVAASVIGLNVAMIAARWSLLFFKGGLLEIGIAGARAAGSILSATKKIRVAILGLSMMNAVGASGGMFAGLIAGASGAVATITGIVSSIGAALAAITAPVWALIAAIVAAIAGAALAVYNYWVPISETVMGFAEVIGDALANMLSAIGEFGASLAAEVGNWAKSKIIDVAAWFGLDPAVVDAAITKAVETVKSIGSTIADAVMEIPSMVGDWISDIFTMNEYSATATAGFRQAGRDAGQAMVDAIKGAFDGLIQWFTSLPSKIVNAIGNIDISSLIKWPSLPWGGGDKKPDGKKAAGGPMVGGKTYLVGENGPELVTPTRSGYVHTAQQTAAMGNGGGRALSISLDASGWSFPGAGDPQAVAEAVLQKISDELEPVISGLVSDTEWATR